MFTIRIQGVDTQLCNWTNYKEWIAEFKVVKVHGVQVPAVTAILIMILICQTLKIEQV